MKYRYLLAFVLISFSQCICARSTTDKIVNTAAAARLVGNIVWSQMYNECKEPSADIWDVEEKERNSIQCITIFKQAGQHDELNNFKKYDREASSNLYKLKKNLKIERVATGGPPEPPDGCEAHHIVPHKESRDWAKPFADRARDVLNICKIDINSAVNGVYLPGRKSPKGDNPECEGVYHPTLHNEDYYEKLANYLEEENNSNGCDGVKKALADIKQILKTPL